MTSSEVVKSLLEIYQAAIKDVEQATSTRHALALCLKHEVHTGVCQCAVLRLKIDIYNAKWVERYKVSNGHHNYYWCPIPNTAETKQEILDSLVFRVHILTQILCLSGSLQTTIL